MTAEIPPKAPDMPVCPDCETDLFVRRTRGTQAADYLCLSCETRWSE